MNILTAAVGPTAPPEEPDDGSWGAPPRRLPATTSPVLSVEGFEGPLDWLLELARGRKIDLARLSILALIDAFASAMNAALSPNVPTPELTRWAAWTVMAAQLTELRSRLLFPADVPEAQKAHAEAEALRRQWISRAEMAAAADWLDRRSQLGREVFARGRPEQVWAGQGAGTAHATAGALELVHDDADSPAAEESDELTELLRGCLVALRLPSHTEIYQPRRFLFWNVSDATTRISQMMQALPSGAALEEFLPTMSGQGAGRTLQRRAAIAATLIAGLELARSDTIILEQESIWTPIMVA